MFIDPPLVRFGSGHITLEKGSDIFMTCDSSCHPDEMNVTIYRDAFDKKGKTYISPEYRDDFSNDQIVWFLVLFSKIIGKYRC